MERAVSAILPPMFEEGTDITGCELYPTVITPFTETGDIDYEDATSLITLFHRNGCDGIFAVCQSSEMFYLTMEEKLALAAYFISGCKARNMRCVVSGHTEDSLEDQLKYLVQLEKLAPDAIVLVSNRLAAENESDEVLLRNLQTIIGRMKPDTRFGIYECPYPYKRLLTPKVIDFMISSQRFDFIKDTCCDLDTMKNRLTQMKGSPIKLFNANAATLLESLAYGAAGYSGIVLNLIPEVFSHFKRLCHKRLVAQQLAHFISACSVYEYQAYPVNAKFLLQSRGIIKQDVTRNGQQPLREAQKKELYAMMHQANRIAYRYGIHAEPSLIFKPGYFFASCHASTVLPMDDGSVLIAYFAGDHEGADNVGIWLSRGKDCVWDAPVCIAKKEPFPHWNPVLFQAGAEIHLVYKVGPDVPSWKSRTMTSGDGGWTWVEVVDGKPSDAASGEGIEEKQSDGTTGKAMTEKQSDEMSGPVRCKPLRLSSGRWLAPNSVETADAWQPRVDISDDDGCHFRFLAEIPVVRDSQSPNHMAGLGAIQPTVWESEPGHVHALMRTTAGRIFRSDSADGGATWYPAYETGLPNNNSGIDIACWNKHLYLVMNPVAGNWAERTPLVVMRSADNGKTFEPFMTLADQEYDGVNETAAEFSYPCCVARDGKLHIAFTWLRRQIAYVEIVLDN